MDIKRTQPGHANAGASSAAGASSIRKSIRTASPASKEVEDFVVKAFSDDDEDDNDDNSGDNNE